MSAAPVSPEKRFYRFDGIRVDPVRRLLVRNGEPVAITPKALSLLLALIERRGEVVEKRELLHTVWRDTFVTEANLTQNISSLRKALGERAGEHRYILTVPGRGYSFSAESFEVVEPEEAAFPEPTPTEATPTEAPEAPGGAETAGTADPEEALPATPVASLAEAPIPRRRWRLAAALLLAAVALGALVAALAVLGPWRGEAPAFRRDGAGPGPRRPVVAVLTFRNSSERRSLDWLGPALADMIRTELTAGSRLRLISGQEMAQARLVLPASADEGSLERLRTRFGAELVVQGSFVAIPLPEKDLQLRVDFRVVEARTGEVTASVNETGNLGQLFDLVSRAGMRLRVALGVSEVSPEDVRAVRAAHSTSTEATRLYTQGMELLRTSNPAAARQLLERAAQADPGSAPIRTALSRAWWELGYEEQAALEARKAMTLSRPLAVTERLAIEGWSYEVAKDWSQASATYRSLWTYFPDNIEHGLQLASVLARGGRAGEALQAVAEMRKVGPPASEDPRIDIAEAIAAQRLSDSATQLRAARAAEAKGRRSGEVLIAGRALLLQGAAHLVDGRAKEAIAAFGQARDLYQRAGDRWGVTQALAYTGLVQHRLGDLGRTEVSYQKALQLATDLGNTAGVAAQLGNLGRLYQDKGNLGLALSYFEKSQGQLAELGDRLLELRVVYQIGEILAARGELDAATVRLDQALIMSRRIGSRLDEARVLVDLGKVVLTQGQPRKALQQHEESLRILGKISSPVVSTVLWNMGDAQVSLGQLAKARESYDQALAAKRQEGDRLGAGRILGSLARLAFYTGDLATARARSEEQLRIGRQTGARALEARALWELGRLDLVADPSDPGVQQRLATSLQLSRETGESLQMEGIRLDLACLFDAQGQTAEALRIAGEVAAWSRARKVPAGEALALRVRARILLRQGQLRRAGAAAGRIRELVRTHPDDLLLRAEVAPVLARVQAAQGDVEGARSELRQASAKAAEQGIVPASLEARLALGEIELAHGDREKALRDLEAVRQEAEARGFRVPVQKARAAAPSWTLARKGERRKS